MVPTSMCPPRRGVFFRFFRAAVLSAAAFLPLACASTPAAAPSAAAEEADAGAAAAGSPRVQAGADVLATLRDLRSRSRDAFDSNHPVEALRHLVALLAADADAPRERDQARAAERADLVRAADAELTAIGARLVLEPGDEWLADGKQVSGDVRELSRGKGLMPSVRLTANYDYGKAVVADAPIRFAFADGSGDVTPQVATDSYGAAAAAVRGIAAADKPVVVRATLVVSSGGATRVFKEVSRDFTYLPASRAARVLALERPASTSADKALGRSPLVDAVSRGLAASGLDLLPYDGAQDPAVFLAALGGDAKAVAAGLGLGGRRASFLVLALAEYDPPRQMTYQGKTYDIYTSDVRAQVRIVRSDGSVVSSRPPVALRGQGGTPAAAVQAALAAARTAVEKDLASSTASIAAALD